MSPIILFFQLIILFILVGLAAFFSASETAFVSLGAYHLRKLDREDPKAKKLEFWFKYPNRVLTTTLVGNTIVESLSSILAASIAYRSSGKVSLAIMAFLVMFFILVFGEIIPKNLGKKYAEKFVMFAILPMKVFTLIFEPINRFLLGFAEVFLNLFGVNIDSILPVLTEEDIKAMISAGEEEGLIEEEERQMIHSIFELGDRMVSEVMIPRVNIVAVDVNSTIKEVLNLVAKEGYSRYPVYRGNFDTIEGVVYLKDIIAKGYEYKDLLVKDIMRPAYFVPETKKINDLMKELQRKQIQMAIVVDEYGGTAGLVTMEDLVEEIVGEISDEYKHDSYDYQRLSDNSYLVKGSMEVEKANELLDLDLSKGEFETVAGFILEYLGRLPRKGEKFIYKGKVFIVHEIYENTIKWIRIRPLKEEKKNEPGFNEE
ncbi:MAG TPA: hemolysin family protein [Candidatus Ratteibacteria bacterium]|jgi:CBS domain containing-hemolysin-like protein|uniref:Magnesium and cobalt efflux protein CorC n=1 Tax=candidate division TA06 bacterium ADurb.Bin131 TaxID=1852827 RepID=A0A1V6C715_UNCT6|nr:MAG: Magnesium and cobalt efflux protein CorC [candidate division TA06 bacterium ADurb.Bin131]HOC02672.1 hemolysin family protein [bacterium]HRS05575.1 hemolysin family protein [Candidatus Ratteibacteria bacterium]HON05723.1 hemolysin family protein [bacterium]HPC29727.1 hemolysin family protein [bacterium]